MEGIQTFKGSWPWPWPWIRPYGIPSCITHRPLPTYQISFKSKTFCGRTDGRTDGHFPPSNIIRSTFGSRPKNYTKTMTERAWFSHLLWHLARKWINLLLQSRSPHGANTGWQLVLRLCIALHGKTFLLTRVKKHSCNNLLNQLQSYHELSPSAINYLISTRQCRQDLDKHRVLFVDISQLLLSHAAYVSILVWCHC